jgi:3-phenylpropionate/cinnamic acid dioxygenase small subunit
VPPRGRRRGRRDLKAEDRAEIADLINRYAHICDSRSFEALRDCFTPDARAEYSGVALEPGVEHIIAHMAPLADVIVTQHVVGSIAIELDGDGATAQSYTVVHFVRPDAGGHEVVHRGLRYDDRLVRTAAGWRIYERMHRVLWSTIDPTEWPVPKYVAPSGDDQGAMEAHR